MEEQVVGQKSDADNPQDYLVRSIQEQATVFGADLAGLVNLADLQTSPSYAICKYIGHYADGNADVERTISHEPVKLPGTAKSAVVIAIHHSRQEPELDWWVSKPGSLGNTAGNRLLMRTMAKLADWLTNERGIECFKIPYNVEMGGVFMKDAAVLAGLGCIGKNNILVTPKFGPRVRLRVMLLAENLPSTGVLDFDPCTDCAEPCRTVCPEKSFAEQVYSPEVYGLAELPGRSGVFNRQRCNMQMVANESGAETAPADEAQSSQVEVVKYCRRCELACPVGSRAFSS